MITTTVNIYDRTLNMNQLYKILHKLDDDMLYDLARSINEEKDKKEIIEILRQLHVAKPSSKEVIKLHELFGVTPTSIASVDKTRNNHEHDFDDAIKAVDNFEPAKSPTILPGVAYETNREKRELCEITDVPDVNFNMPTVPDLPILD